MYTLTFGDGSRNQSERNGFKAYPEDLEEVLVMINKPRLDSINCTWTIAPLGMVWVYPDAGNKDKRVNTEGRHYPDTFQMSMEVSKTRALIKCTRTDEMRAWWMNLKVKCYVERSDEAPTASQVGS
mmetsp:Transcript_88942/g.250496  ORF Transcript_88942/g.250496 Transcript_88942/m.250496 type:complete len:126 (+) Transcript_88942:1-378(+)